VNTGSTLYLDEQTDFTAIGAISIALIGPDEDRRKAASAVLAKCPGGIIREYSSYPPSLNDVPKLIEQNYDVIIIDLDSRPDYALHLVENICSNGATTVMGYSLKADSEMLVRCMRAGARELLTLPFVESVVLDAMIRASVRRPSARPLKKTGGRLMAFLGAKGGDGVTTLACNFAVSMAKESGQSTLLIDLDLPLGDAALNLGVVAEYSTINALQNAARLDSSFLSKLLVKHNSGVSVLAAPGKFPQFDASHAAIDKLLEVARQEFDNVVVDMGSRLDLMDTTIFRDGATVYLVIQAGIAGLRNANRLISQYFATGIPKLEIVLNRFQSRTMGVDEAQITKALTRSAQWKIPNDYAAVRRMQHTAIPLALEDSPISRLIRQMTRTACGMPPTPEKNSSEKGSSFSLKNLGRSFSSKLSSPEEPPVAAPVESAPVAGKTAAVDATEQPEATARNASQHEVAAAGLAQPEAAQTPLAASAESTVAAEAEAENATNASASVEAREPQTRTYRGATYIKGTDGKWYLQKGQSEAVEEESVKPLKPAVNWPAPSPIAYGTRLSAAELNATASVPGKFVYTPAEGEVLAAGEHSLSADFTPEDEKGFTTAQVVVTLKVTQTTPILTWAAPAPIAYGAALGGLQLNATASVPGKFTYSPAAGEVLTAGEHSIEVAFLPQDAVNYAPAKASTPLTVTKATPIVLWPAAETIVQGTPLGADQLNATTLVAGSLEYTPPAGEVLTVGKHLLSVTFTPKDEAQFNVVHATVPLTVSEVPAVETPQLEPAQASVEIHATPLDAAPKAVQVAKVPALQTELPLEASPAEALAPTPTQSEEAMAAEELAAPATEPVCEPVVEPPVVALPVVASPVVASPVVALEETPVKTPDPITPIQETQVHEVEAPVVEASTQQIAEPVIEPVGEPVGEPIVEPVLKPVEESVSAPIAESTAAAPQKTSAEVGKVRAADLPAQAAEETVVEAVAEATIPLKAAPVVERPAQPTAEAAVEAHPTAPLEAVAENTVQAQKADREEAPAIPAVVAKVAAGTPVVVPGKSLVKLPPPKFTFEAGSGLNLMGTAVFPDGTTIYLVMQPGSGGEVDSQRLVSQFLTGGTIKPEIAIQRFEPHSETESDAQSAAEMARPVEAQLQATAQPAFNPYKTAEKKKGFSLNGLRKSLWARVSAGEKIEDFTRLDLKSAPETAAPSPFATTAQVRVASGFAAPLPAQEAGISAASAPQEEPSLAPAPPLETRTYQGATYVKGADGKWHLQQMPNRAVKRESQVAPETAANAAPAPEAQRAPVAPEPAPEQVQAEPVQPEPVQLAPAQDAPVKAEVPEAGEVEDEAENEPVRKQIAVQARVKAPVKSSAKAPARKAGNPATKAAAKTKSSAKPKASVKKAAKKSVKAPAKAAAKAVKPVKKAVKATARPAAKSALKGKKAVKAPVKKAIRNGKTGKIAGAKAPAKGKKPLRSASKAPVKVPARKPVKPSAKPVAKKKAAKAPASKPVKKR
jgi:pilus assembly protein CpaE